MALSKAYKAKKMKHLHEAMVSPMEIKEPPSTLDLKVDELPAMKNWKVGSTYTLKLKVKQRSMSEGGYDGTQPLRGTFEVLSAESVSDSEGQSDSGDTYE